MGNILYLAAVLLVIFWALGFFIYSIGSLIHILLLIAAIAVLMCIIKEKEL